MWVGLVAAILLYTLGFGAALNARVWLASAGSNHTGYGLETFDRFAWSFAGIAGASAAVLGARRIWGLSGRAAPLLWALLVAACFSAFSAYMYPRNGGLMPYETWLQAHMPDPPAPWEAEFWHPLTGR